MARVKGISAFLPVYLPDILDHWHRCQRRARRGGDNTLLTQYKIYENSHKFRWPVFFKLGPFGRVLTHKILKQDFLQISLWIDYQPWRLWKHLHSLIFSMKFKCLLCVLKNHILFWRQLQLLFLKDRTEVEIGGFYLLPCLEFHLP